MITDVLPGRVGDLTRAVTGIPVSNTTSICFELGMTECRLRTDLCVEKTARQEGSK